VNSAVDRPPDELLCTDEERKADGDDYRLLTTQTLVASSLGWSRVATPRERMLQNPLLHTTIGRTESSAVLTTQPVVLVVQAVMSYVPCQIWRFLNRRSGVHLSALMDAAHVSSEASYLEIREKAIRYIVNQMDRYLLAQRDYRTGCFVRIKHFIAKVCCVIGGKLYGNYLITAYLTIKAIYVINAVGQLFLLDALLVNDYHLYGAYIVERLLRGQDWSQSERFPRVTLCEFPIRRRWSVAQSTDTRQ